MEPSQSERGTGPVSVNGATESCLLLPRRSDVRLGRVGDSAHSRGHDDDGHCGDDADVIPDSCCF